MLAFEQYLAEPDESLLTDIEAYNEEDCRATLELRDWLLGQRPEAEAQYGVSIPFRGPPEVREPDEESAEVLTETERLRAELLVGAEEGDERWLAAQLLEYHRREARPGWWWYFRRFEMTDDELIEDAEAIAGLVHDGAEPEPFKNSFDYRFTFPAQQHHLDAGPLAAADLAAETERKGARAEASGKPALGAARLRSARLRSGRA